jgi:transcriptional regulator with XRE-family HTH domain
MKLHEKIKILRKEKGISQQEFANQLGIHLTHVSRLENGHYQPSLEVLKKMMEIFKVSADYLVNDDTDSCDANVKDKSMAERLRLIDGLEEEERKALGLVIDSMLTKKSVLDLLTKREMMAGRR